MPALGNQPLVDAAALARLTRLDVVARVIVTGLHVGTHRSRHRGHSVDFADHRQYVPGDDLRHLDWKVLGRSDRLVLKRYEAEVDLSCVICVDGSASMGYQGERASVSKYRYASVLAATFAHLVLEQQDRAGLVLFHETAAFELKPARQGQMERICHALEAHKPISGTDAKKSLEHLAAPNRHQGLVVVFSDFLLDPAEFEQALDRLCYSGHEVALVWVLDPDETDLGVATVSRFEGMEMDGQITAEPRALREAYLAEVRSHRLALQRMCRQRRAVLVECTTGEPPQLPLNRLMLTLHDESR